MQNGDLPTHVQKLKATPQSLPKPKRGLVPTELNLSNHEARCLAQLRSKDKDIEKYIYLAALKDRDPYLFYKLCLTHTEEITPIVYTPVVGDACLQYSHIYQNPRNPDGLFISIQDKGHIRDVLANWPRLDDARITVVTDGSRILGLGDLGLNGMPIPMGKLSLYVVGAGIRPESTVPICLDLGTNTQEYLDDPLYLGTRQKRVSDEEMEEFMDEFMDEISKAFPKMLIQFEDFQTTNAFKYLDRYRTKYPVFNDDIQGTGAVVLGGFMNAAKFAAEEAGEPLGDFRIVFFGAGSAGVGVATQLMSFFLLNGLTKEEARRRIWLVDSQGLVFNARGPLPEHKKYFSRDDYEGERLTNLVDIIEYVKPHALIGLSTIPGAFPPEVISLMSTYNRRPIIFPLSNPVRLSECTFEDAVQHSKGKVLFASGSPFSKMDYEGKVMTPGQGNNMYVFPGIGLGAILARATEVTDSMIEASSRGLADSLTKEERDAQLLYPQLERIRDISAHVARAVIREAQKCGVDRSTELRSMNDDELFQFVKNKMWDP